MSKDYRASAKIPYEEKKVDTVKKEAVLFEPPYFEYGWRDTYFASQESCFGPQVMWVKTDSSPYIVDEEGNYILTEEYTHYPIIFGIKEDEEMFKYVDSYYGPMFYKQEWLTKNFWLTERWEQALKMVSMDDGNDYLRDALALDFLRTDVADAELRSCKSVITSNLPFAISLDTLSGSKMKDVLNFFTSTMHEKYRN